MVTSSSKILRNVAVALLIVTLVATSIISSTATLGAFADPVDDAQGAQAADAQGAQAAETPPAEGTPAATEEAPATEEPAPDTGEGDVEALGGEIQTLGGSTPSVEVPAYEPPITNPDIALDKTATRTGENEWEVKLTLNGNGAAQPQNIETIFAVDNSTSMKDKIYDAKNAANRLMDDLLASPTKGSVKMGLYVFSALDSLDDPSKYASVKLEPIEIKNNGVRNEANISQLRTAIASTQISAKSGTDFSQPLLSGYNYFKDSKAPSTGSRSQAFILITDGADNSSRRAAATSVAANMLSAGVTLYTVGIDLTLDKNTMHKTRHRLQTLSLGQPYSDPAPQDTVPVDSRYPNYHEGASAELSLILSTIADNISGGFIQGTVSDAVGLGFEIVPGTLTVTAGKTPTSRTVDKNGTTIEVLTWEIDQPVNSAELKYRVRLTDPTATAYKNRPVPTNYQTSYTYYDNEGNQQKGTFPYPWAFNGRGSVAVKVEGVPDNLIPSGVVSAGKEVADYPEDTATISVAKPPTIAGYTLQKVLLNGSERLNKTDDNPVTYTDEDVTTDVTTPQGRWSADGADKIKTDVPYGALTLTYVYEKGKVDDEVNPPALAKNATRTGENEWEVNLTLSGNGAAQPQGIETILAIDNSTSMHDRLENAKAAANQLLDDLLASSATGSVKIGLYAFSALESLDDPAQYNSVKLEPIEIKNNGVRNEANIQQIRNTINGVQGSPVSGTDFYRVMQAGLDYFGSSSAPSAGSRSQAFILITDGSDNSSRKTQATNCAAQMLERGISFYTVGIDLTNDMNSVHRARHRLQTLSLGQSYENPPPQDTIPVDTRYPHYHEGVSAELSAILSSIADEITGSYVQGTVTDQIATGFELVPGTVNVTAGATPTVSGKTITWTIDQPTNLAQLTYRIRMTSPNSSMYANRQVPTNAYARYEYKSGGETKTIDFPKPTAFYGKGSITVAVQGVPTNLVPTGVLGVFQGVDYPEGTATISVAKPPTIADYTLEKVLLSGSEVTSMTDPTVITHTNEDITADFTTPQGRWSADGADKVKTLVPYGDLYVTYVYTATKAGDNFVPPTASKTATRTGENEWTVNLSLIGNPMQSTSKNIDVIIAMDTSSSMGTGNRLAEAKKAALELVDGLYNSKASGSIKMGFFKFGSLSHNQTADAYTPLGNLKTTTTGGGVVSVSNPSPYEGTPTVTLETPTFEQGNHRIIKNAINNAYAATGDDGTDFSVPLNTALSDLKASYDALGGDVTQYVILITDGSDNSNKRSDATTYAANLIANGVNLYTVGTDITSEPNTMHKSRHRLQTLSIGVPYQDPAPQDTVAKDPRYPHYYEGSASELSGILSSISDSFTSGLTGTVTDILGTGFALVPNSISTNVGTATQTQNQISWKVEGPWEEYSAASLLSSATYAATLTYKVYMTDPDATKNYPYPTNKSAYFAYKDRDGTDKQVHFPSPIAFYGKGSITLQYQGLDASLIPAGAAKTYGPVVDYPHGSTSISIPKPVQQYNDPSDPDGSYVLDKVLLNGKEKISANATVDTEYSDEDITTEITGPYGRWSQDGATNVKTKTPWGDLTVTYVYKKATGDDNPPPLDKTATRTGENEWEVNLSVESGAASTAQDVIVMLAIDKSSSMETDPNTGLATQRLEHAKQAAEEFLDSLLASPATGKVTFGFVAFNRTVEESFTTVIKNNGQATADADTMRTAIRAIKSPTGQGTDFAPPLAKICNTLREVPDSTLKKVIFISDGYQSVYTNNADTLALEILTTYGATIYTVGVDMQDHAANYLDKYRSRMQRLSRGEKEEAVSSATVANDPNYPNYYEGTSAQLAGILTSIADSFYSNFTSGTVTDKIGADYELVPGSLSANIGTPTVNGDVITWQIDTPTDTPTLTYKVRLKNPDASKNKKAYTNEYAKFTWTDDSGKQHTSDFPSPYGFYGKGSIEIKVESTDADYPIPPSSVPADLVKKYEAVDYPEGTKTISIPTPSGIAIDYFEPSAQAVKVTLNGKEVDKSTYADIVYNNTDISAELLGPSGRWSADGADKVKTDVPYGDLVVTYYYDPTSVPPIAIDKKIQNEKGEWVDDYTIHSSTDPLHYQISFRVPDDANYAKMKTLMITDTLPSGVAWIGNDAANYPFTVKLDETVVHKGLIGGGLNYDSATNTLTYEFNTSGLVWVQPGQTVTIDFYAKLVQQNGQYPTEIKNSAGMTINNKADEPSGDETVTYNKGLISGTAKDTDDGSALPNVTVNLYKDSKDGTPIATAQTDAQGKYSFEVEAGNYVVGFPTEVTKDTATLGLQNDTGSYGASDTPNDGFFGPFEVALGTPEQQQETVNADYAKFKPDKIKDTLSKQIKNGSGRYVDELTVYDAEQALEYRIAFELPENVNGLTELTVKDIMDEGLRLATNVADGWNVQVFVDDEEVNIGSAKLQSGNEASYTFDPATLKSLAGKQISMIVRAELYKVNGHYVKEIVNKANVLVNNGQGGPDDDIKKPGPDADNSGRIYGTVTTEDEDGVKTPAANVPVKIYEDTNGNGQPDPGEKVVMELETGPDGKYDSATKSDKDSGDPILLPEGDYVVEVPKTVDKKPIVNDLGDGDTNGDNDKPDDGLFPVQIEYGPDQQKQQDANYAKIPAPDDATFLKKVKDPADGTFKATDVTVYSSTDEIEYSVEVKLPDDVKYYRSLDLIDKMPEGLALADSPSEGWNVKVTVNGEAIDIGSAKVQSGQEASYRLDLTTTPKITDLAGATVVMYVKSKFVKTGNPPKYLTKVKNTAKYQINDTDDLDGDGTDDPNEKDGPTVDNNGLVSGKVTDADTGAPIAGVEVNVYPDEDQDGEPDEGKEPVNKEPVKSGEDGTYTIDIPEEGHYVVVVPDQVGDKGIHNDTGDGDTKGDNDKPYDGKFPVDITFGDPADQQKEQDAQYKEPSGDGFTLTKKVAEIDSVTGIENPQSEVQATDWADETTIYNATQTLLYKIEIAAKDAKALEGVQQLELIDDMGQGLALADAPAGGWNVKVFAGSQEVELGDAKIQSGSKASFTFTTKTVPSVKDLAGKTFTMYVKAKLVQVDGKYLPTVTNKGKALLNGEEDDEEKKIPDTDPFVVGNSGLIKGTLTLVEKVDGVETTTPVEGETVKIYKDTDKDGQPDGDPVITVTTDKDGNYTTEGYKDAAGKDYIIEAGDYVVVLPRVVENESINNDTGLGDTAGDNDKPDDGLFPAHIELNGAEQQKTVDGVYGGEPVFDLPEPAVKEVRDKEAATETWKQDTVTVHDSAGELEYRITVKMPAEVTNYRSLDIIDNMDEGLVLAENPEGGWNVKVTVDGEEVSIGDAKLQSGSVAEVRFTKTTPTKVTSLAGKTVVVTVKARFVKVGEPPAYPTEGTDWADVQVNDTDDADGDNEKDDLYSDPDGDGEPNGPVVENKGLISGTVTTDPRNGTPVSPIPNVPVKVYPDKDGDGEPDAGSTPYQAQTGPDGKYSVDVPEGKYVVVIPPVVYDDNNNPLVVSSDPGDGTAKDKEGDGKIPVEIVFGSPEEQQETVDATYLGDPPEDGFSLVKKVAKDENAASQADPTKVATWVDEMTIYNSEQVLLYKIEFKANYEEAVDYIASLKLIDEMEEGLVLAEGEGITWNVKVFVGDEEVDLGAAKLQSGSTASYTFDTTTTPSVKALKEDAFTMYVKAKIVKVGSPAKYPEKVDNKGKALVNGEEDDGTPTIPDAEGPDVGNSGKISGKATAVPNTKEGEEPKPEEPLEGVEVKIYKDDNANGKVDDGEKLLYTLKTGPDGTYTTAGVKDSDGKEILSEGDYIVQVPTRVESENMFKGITNDSGDGTDKDKANDGLFPVDIEFGPPEKQSQEQNAVYGGGKVQPIPTDLMKPVKEVKDAENSTAESIVWKEDAITVHDSTGILEYRITVQMPDDITNYRSLVITDLLGNDLELAPGSDSLRVQVGGDAPVSFTPVDGKASVRIDGTTTPKIAALEGKKVVLYVSAKLKKTDGAYPTEATNQAEVVINDTDDADGEDGPDNLVDEDGPKVDNNGLVTGKVTDADTGEPIEGVKINVYPDEDQDGEPDAGKDPINKEPAVSGPDGTYTLDIPDEGHYVVVAPEKTDDGKGISNDPGTGDTKGDNDKPGDGKFPVDITFGGPADQQKEQDVEYKLPDPDQWDVSKKVAKVDSLDGYTDPRDIPASSWVDSRTVYDADQVLLYKITADPKTAEALNGVVSVELVDVMGEGLELADAAGGWNTKAYAGDQEITAAPQISADGKTITYTLDSKTTPKLADLADKPFVTYVKAKLVKVGGAYKTEVTNKGSVKLNGDDGHGPDPVVTNNSGLIKGILTEAIDGAEGIPVAGETVKIYEDKDGDGVPDDTNGDGKWDDETPLMTLTTGQDGKYTSATLSDADTNEKPILLPTGDYVVVLPDQITTERGDKDITNDLGDGTAKDKAGDGLFPVSLVVDGSADQQKDVDGTYDGGDVNELPDLGTLIKKVKDPADGEYKASAVTVYSSTGVLEYSIEVVMPDDLTNYRSLDIMDKLPAELELAPVAAGDWNVKVAVGGEEVTLTADQKAQTGPVAEYRFDRTTTPKVTELAGKKVEMFVKAVMVKDTAGKYPQEPFKNTAELEVNDTDDADGDGTKDDLVKDGPEVTNSGKISGTVTDGETGDPIADIPVKAYPDEDQDGEPDDGSTPIEGKSGPDGTYQIDVPEGSYVVVVPAIMEDGRGISNDPGDGTDKDKPSDGKFPADIVFGDPDTQQKEQDAVYKKPDINPDRLKKEVADIENAAEIEDPTTVTKWRKETTNTNPEERVELYRITFEVPEADDPDGENLEAVVSLDIADVMAEGLQPAEGLSWNRKLYVDGEELAVELEVSDDGRTINYTFTPDTDPTAQELLGKTITMYVKANPVKINGAFPAEITNKGQVQVNKAPITIIIVDTLSGVIQGTLTEVMSATSTVPVKEQEVLIYKDEDGDGKPETGEAPFLTLKTDDDGKYTTEGLKDSEGKDIILPTGDYVVVLPPEVNKKPITNDKGTEANNTVDDGIFPVHLEVTKGSTSQRKTVDGTYGGGLVNELPDLSTLIKKVKDPADGEYKASAVTVYSSTGVLEYSIEVVMPDDLTNYRSLDITDKLPAELELAPVEAGEWNVKVAVGGEEVTLTEAQKAQTGNEAVYRFDLGTDPKVTELAGKKVEMFVKAVMVKDAAGKYPQDPFKNTAELEINDTPDADGKDGPDNMVVDGPEVTNSGKISGKVTDGETGDPIADIPVKVYPDEDQDGEPDDGSTPIEGKSGPDGTYQIDVPEGSYVVVVPPKTDDGKPITNDNGNGDTTGDNDKPDDGKFPVDIVFGDPDTQQKEQDVKYGGGNIPLELFELVKEVADIEDAAALADPTTVTEWTDEKTIYSSTDVLLYRVQLQMPTEAEATEAGLLSLVSLEIGDEMEAGLKLADGVDWNARLYEGSTPLNVVLGISEDKRTVSYEFKEDTTPKAHDLYGKTLTLYVKANVVKGSDGKYPTQVKNVGYVEVNNKPKEIIIVEPNSGKIYGKAVEVVEKADGTTEDKALANVPVTIYKDEDGDGVPDDLTKPLYTLMTEADGTYTTEGATNSDGTQILPEGDYVVEFPDNWDTSEGNKALTNDTGDSAINTKGDGLFPVDIEFGAPEKQSREQNATYGGGPVKKLPSVPAKEVKDAENGGNWTAGDITVHDSTGILEYKITTTMPTDLTNYRSVVITDILGDGFVLAPGADSLQVQVGEEAPKNVTPVDGKASVTFDGSTTPKVTALAGKTITLYVKAQLKKAADGSYPATATNSAEVVVNNTNDADGNGTDDGLKDDGPTVSNMGTISGKVTTDPVNGTPVTPIENVKVKVYEDVDKDGQPDKTTPAKETETEADGTYSVDVPAGNYVVVFPKVVDGKVVSNDPGDGTDKDKAGDGTFPAEVVYGTPDQQHKEQDATYQKPNPVVPGTFEKWVQADNGQWVKEKTIYSKREVIKYKIEFELGDMAGVTSLTVKDLLSPDLTFATVAPGNYNVEVQVDGQKLTEDGVLNHERQTKPNSGPIEATWTFNETTNPKVSELSGAKVVMYVDAQAYNDGNGYKTELHNKGEIVINGSDSIYTKEPDPVVYIEKPDFGDIADTLSKLVWDEAAKAYVKETTIHDSTSELQYQIQFQVPEDSVGISSIDVRDVMEGKGLKLAENPSDGWNVQVLVGDKVVDTSTQKGYTASFKFTKTTNPSVDDLKGKTVTMRIKAVPEKVSGDYLDTIVNTAQLILNNGDKDGDGTTDDEATQQKDGPGVSNKGLIYGTAKNMDDGGSPMAGIPVVLYADADLDQLPDDPKDILNSKTTGADGTYAFEVPKGNYVVKFPAVYYDLDIQKDNGSGSDPATVDDGIFGPLNIAYGTVEQQQKKQDAEYKKTKAEIKGKLWHDIDGDGIIDKGAEEGDVYGGVEVFLYYINSATSLAEKIDSYKTDGSGSYVFRVKPEASAGVPNQYQIYVAPLNKLGYTTVSTDPEGNKLKSNGFTDSFTTSLTSTKIVNGGFVGPDLGELSKKVVRVENAAGADITDAVSKTDSEGEKQYIITNETYVIIYQIEYTMPSNTAGYNRVEIQDVMEPGLQVLLTGDKKPVVKVNGVKQSGNVTYNDTTKTLSYVFDESTDFSKLSNAKITMENICCNSVGVQVDDKLKFPAEIINKGRLLINDGTGSNPDSPSPNVINKPSLSATMKKNGVALDGLEVEISLQSDPTHTVLWKGVTDSTGYWYYAPAEFNTLYRVFIHDPQVPSRISDTVLTKTPVMEPLAAGIIDPLSKTTVEAAEKSLSAGPKALARTVLFSENAEGASDAGQAVTPQSDSDSSTDTTIGTGDGLNNHWEINFTSDDDTGGDNGDNGGGGTGGDGGDGGTGGTGGTGGSGGTTEPVVNVTVPAPVVNVTTPAAGPTYVTVNPSVNETARPSNVSAVAPPASIVVNTGATDASASGAGDLAKPAGLDDGLGTEIEDEEIPLTKPRYWHLLDVILTAISVILGFILLARGLRRKDEESDYMAEVNAKIQHTRSAYGFAGTGFGIATLVILLLTQDFTGKMRWWDIWAIVMLVIVVIQVIILFSIPAFRKEEDEEYEYEYEEEPVYSQEESVDQSLGTFFVGTRPNGQ
jgi:fimbrial isopeptide formation D2 family protein